MRLVLIAVLYLVSESNGHRFRRNVGKSENAENPEKSAMLTTNRFEYFEEKINQIAGISCDLCIKAVYGVNYDFVQLKKNVVEMIRLDCEALFHERSEEIAQCIRFMTEKVEKYSNKVEKFLDSRHICVLLRVCSPEDSERIAAEMTDENKSDSFLL